jgi:sec-independent protein translocase protein TatB
MFGIEFPELIVIAVVALIVIGPEHLPKVARTMGHLWGRAQRYINGVKADMSRDMALEELRKVQHDVKQEVENIGQSINQATQEFGRQAGELEAEVIASKYDLGKSIPENEISAKVLPNNELLKSEMPKTNIPRHEIIEEHHAVLPVSAEQKNTNNT